MRAVPAIAVILTVLNAAAAAAEASPESGASESWLGTPVWIAPDVYTGPTDGPADPLAAEQAFRRATAAAERGDAPAVLAEAARALHHDPNHDSARILLGYVLTPDGWKTPYEARQADRGRVWDKRFGWVTDADRERLAAGERRVGRRWVTAEVAARRRSDIESGWQVRTDRFVVTTNHSLEAAAGLSAELEGLAQAWRQLFADYWLDPRDLRARFTRAETTPVIDNAAARGRSRRPMRVFLHRDRASYVDYLRRRQPGVEESLGVYLDVAREAHFFHQPDAAELDAEGGVGPRATRYHEVAHQLFQERGPGGTAAGRDHHQWLVEGVACYFELLAPVADRPAMYTLGHPAQGRLRSAVAYGPAMPLAELAGLSQAELLRAPNVARAYSQATGVVAMLRHGTHAERDRAALSRTLRAVYGGRPDAEELARQVGRGYDELDREYARFRANLSH